MITNTVLRRELHRNGVEIVGVFVASKLTDSLAPDDQRAWEHWLLPVEVDEYLALESENEREIYLDLLIDSLADTQRQQWTAEKQAVPVRPEKPVIISML